MIIMAWYSIGEDRVSLSSIIIKMLCAIIGGLALAVFVFMSKRMYDFIITVYRVFYRF